MRKGRMRFCFELAILIWQTLQHHEEEEDRLNDDAFGRVRQGCKVVCWQRSRSGRRRRERGFSQIQVPTIRELTVQVQWTM